MSKYVSNFPHGIMFHHFHEANSPASGQGSISADQFDAILNFIGIENFLSPEKWIYKLRNNKLKKNDLCLTFDDALVCQYDICLPILEKYNLKGFWFVYSSVFEGKTEKLEIYTCFRSKYFNNIDDFYRIFFEKYKESNSRKINKTKLESFIQQRKSAFPFYTFNDLKFRFIRDETLHKEEYEKLMDEIIEERDFSVRDISRNLWLKDSHLKSLSEKGHFIGLHSYNHPTVFAKLSYEEQLVQYKLNYEHISKVCNKEIVAMSHPCGSSNDDTLKILKQLGILCGFRSNMAFPNEKEINPNGLTVAREDSANILKMMSK